MIYAIGDIHGERAKLRGLLSQILPDVEDEDQLVFIGDYVDRGHDACGVIEDLLALQSSHPNTVFLRGNHEQLMLNARAVFQGPHEEKDFYESAMWFAQGGAETAASYPHPGRIWWERVPSTHWEFLEATRPSFAAGAYFFVHAGIVPPGSRFEEAEPWLWIREPFISSTVDFGAVVVFGHTPTRNQRPLVMPNKIGIDTGATYGGPLTAVVLDPEEPYDPETLRFLQFPPTQPLIVEATESW